MFAVSLNVPSGICLIKQAKLYMCMQKPYNHNEDGHTVPCVSGHGSVQLSYAGNVITRTGLQQQIYREKLCTFQFWHDFNFNVRGQRGQTAIACRHIFNELYSNDDKRTQHNDFNYVYYISLVVFNSLGTRDENSTICKQRRSWWGGS